MSEVLSGRRVAMQGNAALFFHPSSTRPLILFFFALLSSLYPTLPLPVSPPTPAPPTPHPNTPTPIWIWPLKVCTAGLQGQLWAFIPAEWPLGPQCGPKSSQLHSNAIPHITLDPKTQEWGENPKPQKSSHWLCPCWQQIYWNGRLNIRQTIVICTEPIQ